MKILDNKILLGAVIALLVIALLQTCNSYNALKKDLKRSQDIAEQNAAAMQQTILRFEKNRAGDTEAIRLAFVSKLEDLRALNKELYDESKKEIGNLKAIINGKLTASQKPLSIGNALEQYPDSMFGLRFSSVSENWRVKGISRFGIRNNSIFPDSTTILENAVSIDLVMGFKELDDKYEIFARSTNKDVIINKLDGALFIPKKPDLLTPAQRPKRIGLGVSLGYGVGPGGIGPYAGFGLNYNLIRF